MTRLARDLLLAALWLLPTSASAETMTFRVQSNYAYSVQLEFYSQSRSAAWPGDGMAYVIRDDEVHEYVLNCRSGEKICYGAWVDGNPRLFWGAGHNGRQGCSSCCYSCDGSETAIITLEED